MLTLNLDAKTVVRKIANKEVFVLYATDGDNEFIIDSRGRVLYISDYIDGIVEIEPARIQTSWLNFVVSKDEYGYQVKYNKRGFNEAICEEMNIRDISVDYFRQQEENGRDAYERGKIYRKLLDRLDGFDHELGNLLNPTKVDIVIRNYITILHDIVYRAIFGKPYFVDVQGAIAFNVDPIKNLDKEYINTILGGIAERLGNVKNGFVGFKDVTGEIATTKQDIEE